MCGKNHGFKRIITGNLRFMRINFYAYFRSSFRIARRFVDRITHGGEGTPTCTHNGKGYPSPHAVPSGQGTGQVPGNFRCFSGNPKTLLFNRSKKRSGIYSMVMCPETVYFPSVG